MNGSEMSEQMSPQEDVLALEPMVAVADFTGIERALDSAEPCEQLALGTGGSLIVPDELPSEIKHLITLSSRLEASRRDISEARVSLTIRVEELPVSDEANEPHFDSTADDDTSFYILCSPPATVQFRGVLTPHMRDINDSRTPGSITHLSAKEWYAQPKVRGRIQAQPLMAWHLYHGTGRSLHARSWKPMQGTKRYMIRVTFDYSKSE